MAIAAPSTPIFPTVRYDQGEAEEAVGVFFEGQLAEIHGLLVEAANDNSPRSARRSRRQRVFIPGWPMLEAEEEAREESPTLPRFAPGW